MSILSLDTRRWGAHELELVSGNATRPRARRYPRICQNEGVRARLSGCTACPTSRRPAAITDCSLPGGDFRYSTAKTARGDPPLRQCHFRSNINVDFKMQRI